MMKEPKFKKGDKVFAETLGKGVVQDAYRVSSYPYRKIWYYHIKQGIALLGNIPEDWIKLLAL